MQFFLLNFQHKVLTAIHKHYSLDEWIKFSKENPNVLPVSSLKLTQFWHFFTHFQLNLLK